MFSFLGSIVGLIFNICLMLLALILKLLIIVGVIGFIVLITCLFGYSILGKNKAYKYLSKNNIPFIRFFLDIVKTAISKLVLITYKSFMFVCNKFKKTHR